jgi:hypothetical protein
MFMCQNFKNPTGTDVAIVATETTMSAGSHHLFVFHDPSYDADSGTAPCSGVEFHDYLHLAQSPHTAISYPAGIGRSLKGAEGLRILVHYLNTTSATLNAQIEFTYTYVAPSGVQHLGAQMFLDNTTIFVPPGTSTQSRTYNTPYDIEMISAISHMHKQGVHFLATAGSQTLYDGKDWDEPKEHDFSPFMHIASGTTITWACDYNNQTSNFLTFGESAQSNEMCILAGLFYPSQPGAHDGEAIDPP